MNQDIVTAQIDILTREIISTLESFKRTDTVENRKELIKMLESLIRCLTPPDNTPRQPSCANYII